MRNHRSSALVATLALLVGAREVRAEALFASPPHFLALRDRQQVVFFINEPVVGALASRMGSQSIEIVIPRAGVDPTLRNTSFTGSESDAAGRTSVALAAGARGNAAIHITTTAPVGGVHAYSEDDPPRLIVDLMAAAAVATPTAVRTASTESPFRKVPPSGAAAGTGAASDARPGVVATAEGHAISATVAPRATSTTAAATATPRPTATPASTATRAGVAATHANPTAAPPAKARPPAPPRAPSAAPDVKPSPPSPVGPAAPTRLRSTVAVATVERASDDTLAATAMPCRFVRVAGVPFCAPDPDAIAYAAAPELARIARAVVQASIATGQREPHAASVPATTSEDAAALYLSADRELVTRAASGRLLPVVDAYRRALRRAPGFFDAPRARLNVALVYRTLGFTAELQSIAVEGAGEPGRALYEALVGDLALEQGSVERAVPAYARADRGGGVGPCLAARGRAAVALAAGSPHGAAVELAQLPMLCPRAILSDPETLRCQARERLAAGDAAGARSALERLRGAFGAAGEGTLLEDLGQAAEASGDLAAARREYTALASGRFGARLASRGTLALARLDAAGGDVAAGFRRLQTLAPETAAVERRRMAGDALVNALRRGAHQDAVAIMAEHGVASASLAPEDQILVARSYRALGLADEADALLRRMRDALGASAPDALWDERGSAALAAGAPAQALVAADDWLRTRGTAASPAARALRARALAALGQSAAATDEAAQAAAVLGGAEARALRLDVAERLRTVDAAAAARLAREALADESLPALEPRAAAAAWRTLAEASEASGDDAAALAAYTTLTARYGDQPSAAGAAYRVARLTAGTHGGAAAAAAYGEVARSRDTVERRVGTAAQAYEAIVRPFEGRREEP